MPSDPTPLTEEAKGLVRCSRCGHAEIVGSATGIAPTPEIIAAVCERDPCPACGRKTMEAMIDA